TLSCTGWGFFLAKCDAGGHVNILEHAAGAGANFNYGMAEDANGCIYICGTSTSDSIPFDTIILRKPFNHPGWWLFLAKYNNNLKPLWAKTAKGDNSDFAWSVTTGIGYTVYLTGSVSGNASIFDNDTLTTPAPAKMFLAKLKSEDGTALAGLPKENNDDGFMVYPNPTTGKFSLRITEGVPAVTGPRIAAITIYNALGENVFSAKDLLSGTWIDLSDRAKGIYFVQIRSGKGSSTQKILIR
ncbi:MAG TPA: T9SS type A sorting domain-containing protein, partial [Bacteroidia bacterium]